MADLRTPGILAATSGPTVLLKAFKHQCNVNAQPWLRLPGKTSDETRGDERIWSFTFIISLKHRVWYVILATALSNRETNNATASN